MLKLIYSYNKTGFEAEYWAREIAAASNESVQFIPFNHGTYVEPELYLRAQLLDNLYFSRSARLMDLYAAFESLRKSSGADAVLVDNCQPYHPDFLLHVDTYKVLRTSDGPITAYDRDFAYVHAFDHVLYHSPAYSRDLTMAKKLEYLGAKSADFWPHALFDALHDPEQTEGSLWAGERDIDVIFIGALFQNKMPLLAKVKKAFGSKFRLYGLTNWKRNAYFNVKFGFPGWVRPVRFDEYVALYQRAKIGINVHNRGDYTIGSYRLFDLPGNGVMQISDGGEYLESFFQVGEEIERYGDADELIDKIRYFLQHEEERIRVARNGYRRVMRNHRIHTRLHEAAGLISAGMQRAHRIPAGVGHA